MTMNYVLDYPRPQMVRGNWCNLNGEWDFLFDDDRKGEHDGWYRAFPEEHQSIRVPFTYETKASGIHDETAHETVWYHRSYLLPELPKTDKRIRIHFEGSDYRTKLWVNGCFVGSHEGAYERFSFDITDQLKAGENDLTVRVEDSRAITQPRGKQRWIRESFACWYVQTTGIWKTVWLEEVSESCIDRLKITPDLTNSSVKLEVRLSENAAAEGLVVESTVLFAGQVISRVMTDAKRVLIKQNVDLYLPEETPWGIHTWSPSSPELYDLKIRLLRDGDRAAAV